MVLSEMCVIFLIDSFLGVLMMLFHLQRV